jgi:predicted nucleic acid-binding protein
MMNAVAVAIRRQRIKAEHGASFLSLLSSYNFRIAASPDTMDLPRLHHLAARDHLTAYDTAYLDLAMRLALPLATLDDDMRDAALAEGLTVL